MNKNKLMNPVEFFDILKENTINYKGKYEILIKNSASIYQLLSELLDSNKLHRDHRALISSTIAYFILPRDIYPEEIYGAKGYIDDIYLCLYSLSIIKKEYGISILREHWKGPSQLLSQLLNKEYPVLDKELNHILPKMLDYVGINPAMK
jgi:uncharacterized membrane protein YkvA (DUF1232 family)